MRQAMNLLNHRTFSTSAFKISISSRTILWEEMYKNSCSNLWNLSSRIDYCALSHYQIEWLILKTAIFITMYAILWVDDRCTFLFTCVFSALVLSLTNWLSSYDSCIRQDEWTWEREGEIANIQMIYKIDAIRYIHSRLSLTQCIWRATTIDFQCANYAHDALLFAAFVSLGKDKDACTHHVSKL